MVIYLLTVNHNSLAFRFEHDALEFALEELSHYLENASYLSSVEKKQFYLDCKMDLIKFHPFNTTCGFSASLVIAPLIEEVEDGFLY